MVSRLQHQSDILAPATGHYFSFLDEDGDTKSLPFDGTSYGAPFVTSAAALLKSIAPTLSAPQIKEYLVTHSRGTLNVEGINIPILSFADPLLQLIWDQHCLSDYPSSCSLLDPTTDGNSLFPVSAGVAVSRTCDQVQMTLTPQGESSLLFGASETTAVLGADGFTGNLGLRLFAGNEVSYFQLDCTHNQNHLSENAIVEPPVSVLGCAFSWNQTWENGNYQKTGESRSGQLVIAKCEWTDVLLSDGMNLQASATMSVHLNGDMSMRLCQMNVPPDCLYEDRITPFVGDGTFSAFVQIFGDPGQVAAVSSLCQ